MTRFRLLLLVASVAVIVVAVTRTTAEPPPQVALAPEVPPTPRPTRVPLPTLPPERITSIISRATPVAPTPPTLSAEPEVAVVDYGFSPSQLTVHLGQSVTWTNAGEDGHDVSGDGPGGIWRSGPLAPAEHYTRLFGLTGTYEYVCTIHPEMRGRVVVQP